MQFKRKLEYIKNSKFDFILSHHHEVEKYTEQTNLKFIFGHLRVIKKDF